MQLEEPARAAAPKQPTCHKRFAQLNSMGEVDFQYGDCRSGDGDSTDEFAALPMEMAIPLVPSGVKKTHDAAAERIDAGNVWAFMAVAGEACESEVARHGEATVFGGNDVIDFVPEWRTGLRKLAVLAATARPPPHELDEVAVHGA